MKKSLLLFFISLVYANGVDNWWIYQGVWFDIKVPNSFSYGNTHFCATLKNKKECNSAYFISEDNNQSLYIFSPQWAGTKVEYEVEIQPKNSETLLYDTTQYYDYEQNSSSKTFYDYENNKLISDKNFKKQIVIQKICIKSLNKIRQYVIESNLVTNTRLVLGMTNTLKQKSQICDFNDPILKRFRKSLIQYGD